MLKDSLNKKTYIGDIEPNPKEFGIWIKEDGSAKIYDYVKNEWKSSSSNNDGGGSSSIEYLDISGLSQASMFAKIAISVKWSDTDGGYTISPWGLFSGDDATFKAIAIDLSIPIYNNDIPTEVNLITLGEFTTKFGLPLDAITRITKEQFYSLI